MAARLIADKELEESLKGGAGTAIILAASGQAQEVKKGKKNPNCQSHMLSISYCRKLRSKRNRERGCKREFGPYKKSDKR